MVYAMVSIGILGFIVWAFNILMGPYFRKKLVNIGTICKNPLRELSSKIFLIKKEKVFEKILIIGQFADNRFFFKSGISETTRTIPHFNFSEYLQVLPQQKKIDT